MYNKEDKLDLPKVVRITQKEYDTLRKEKTKQETSMAKIVCNLIVGKYEDKELNNK